MLLFNSHPCVFFFFQERLVPLEMPETICGCLQVSSSVIAGQSIVVVTMNGKKNFMGLGGGHFCRIFFLIFL